MPPLRLELRFEQLRHNHHSPNIFVGITHD
jgi:hypothetical protein